jgi:heme-degrading monooxygenase HmoA
MIIREWRGRANPATATAYPRHFHEKVVPELREVPGFAGAQLGRREIDGKTEFLVLTRWQSMNAIRAFAGIEVDKAVVEPRRRRRADRFRRQRAALRGHRGRAAGSLVPGTITMIAGRLCRMRTACARHELSVHRPAVRHERRWWHLAKVRPPQAAAAGQLQGGLWQALGSSWVSVSHRGARIWSGFSKDERLW